MRKSARVRNYLVFVLAASLAFSSCPLPYKYSPEGYPGSAGAVDPSTPKISASPVVLFSESNGQSGNLIDGQSATTSSNTSISLSSSTVGAVIYYTTDGTTPDPRSSSTQKYGSSLDLTMPDPASGIATKSLSLTVIAIGPNLNPSLITRATIILQSPLAARMSAPIFSPAGGIYDNDLIVLLKSDEYSHIWYTTDGSTPVAGTTTDPVAALEVYIPGQQQTSGGNITLRAIASSTIPSKVDSLPSQATYTFKAATPAADHPGGTYNNDFLLTLYRATAGSEIYYTTDGTKPTPTTASKHYTGPFTVGGYTQLRAIAFRNGYQDSDELSTVYRFEVATPTIDYASGTYYWDFTVQIDCETTGSVLLYQVTYNGVTTNYSENKTAYIQIPRSDATVQISAHATRAGFTNSGTATVDYTIRPMPTLVQIPTSMTLAMPTALPTSNDYWLNQYCSSGWYYSGYTYVVWSYDYQNSSTYAIVAYDGNWNKVREILIPGNRYVVGVGMNGDTGELMVNGQYGFTYVPWLAVRMP